MSLDFYRWFCRDVLRLPDRAAWEEANCRAHEHYQKIRKNQGFRSYTGLPEGHEAADHSVESDGDITAYPEVRRDVS